MDKTMFVTVFSAVGAAFGVALVMLGLATVFEIENVFLGGGIMALLVVGLLTLLGKDWARRE